MTATIKELIHEHYGGHSDEFPLYADGLDDAIIGIDSQTMRVVYSRNKCIDILTAEGMDPEDALEYLEYNTFNHWVGEYTPIWVEDFNW